MKRLRNFFNNRKRSKSTSSAASSEPAKDIKDANDSYEEEPKDYEVKVSDKWDDDNNLSGPVAQAMPMRDEEEKEPAPRKRSILSFFSRKRKDSNTADNDDAPKGDVFANYMDDSSRPIDSSDIYELEKQSAINRSDEKYDDIERVEPMKPAVDSEDKDEPSSPERSLAYIGAYKGDVESEKPKDESNDDTGSISSDKSPKAEIDSAVKDANDNVRDADSDNEKETDNTFVTDDAGKDKNSGRDGDFGYTPNTDAKEESESPKYADNDLEAQPVLFESFGKEPKQEDDSNKILNSDTTEDENRNVASMYESATDSSLNTESKDKDEVEKEVVTPQQDAFAASSIDEEPKANSKYVFDDGPLETENDDQPKTPRFPSDDVKDISNELTADDDSNEPRYTTVTKSLETDEELSAVNRESRIVDNIFAKESEASGERNMSEDEGEVAPQITDVVAPQVADVVAPLVTETNQDEEEQPEVYVMPQRDIGDLVHDLTKAIDAADDVQDSPDDIFEEVKRITDNYIKKNQIDTVEQNQLIYPTALQMLGRRRRFTKGIAGGATLESCLSRASQTFPEAKYFAVVNELYNINAPDLWPLSKGKDKLNDPILNFVDGNKLQESFCDNLYEHMRKEKKLKIKNLVLGELVPGRLFSRDSRHDNAKEFIPRTGRDEFGLKLFQVDPKTLLNDTMSSEFHFEGWQDVSVENESDVVSTDGNIYNPLFVKPAKGLLLKNVDKCRIQAVANTLDSNYLTTGPEGTVLIWRDWTGKHYFDLNQKVEDEDIIDAILRVRSKSTVSANRNKSFYKIENIDESI